MKLLGPIIKKELELKSRDLAFPTILAVINTLLFVAALLCSFSVIAVMRQTHEALYGLFPDMYVVISMAAYIMLLICAPLYTATSISGERETGTYDLLLTTRLTPWEIVLEKLAYAFISMCINLVTCLPAVLVPLMFGGAGLIDAIVLLISFLPGIALVLSAGMCASAVSVSAARSIAMAYGSTLGITVGFILIPVLLNGFAAEGVNTFAYFVLADPLFTVYVVLKSQVGDIRGAGSIFMGLGLSPAPVIAEHAVIAAVIVQLVIGVGFVITAVVNAAPGRYIGKEHGKVR